MAEARLPAAKEAPKELREAQNELRELDDERLCGASETDDNLLPLVDGLARTLAGELSVAGPDSLALCTASKRTAESVRLSGAGEPLPGTFAVATASGRGWLSIGSGWTLLLDGEPAAAFSAAVSLPTT